MKLKKVMALALAIALFCGIFAIPLQAAPPEERIEVIVDALHDEISLFDEELGVYILTDNSAMMGLYCATTGWITECKWYDIYKTDMVGFYKVLGEEGFGLIDINGNMVIEPEWDWIHLSSGIAIVSKNDSYGLVDSKGAVIIEPQYESILDFYEGLAKVYNNGKVGFINTAGRLVSDIVWRDVQNFSESMAAVKNSDGLWGFIDNTGKTVIPCKYENVSSFSNGYASVLEGDTVYVINKAGSKVLSAEAPLALETNYNCEGYIEMIKFFGSEEDVAVIQLKGEENYCYIDRSYNILTESIYKYPMQFNGYDYALTIIPNRFGMEKYGVLKIDRTNGIKINTVISDKNALNEVNYDENIFFEADGKLYDLNGNDLFGTSFSKYIYHFDGSDIINGYIDGKYACVNFEGEVISPLSEYQFYYVSDNLYLATADDGSVKLCDGSGKQISETEEYEEAYAMDGYIFVKDADDNWGIINKNCEVIVEPSFDAICGAPDMEGMIKYKDNGKYGFLNMETQKIIPAKFSVADVFNEGMCWVAEEVLAGAIDKNGDYIIEPLYWGYNDCTGFGSNHCSKSVIPLRKEMLGSYGVLNLKGEKILDFKYDYIGDFSENGIAVFKGRNGDNYGYGLLKLVENNSTVVPEKVLVNDYDIVLYEGCYKVITETVMPEQSADLGVTFVSANENVATVNEVGRVYGVSEGKTAISVISKANPAVMTTVSITVNDRNLQKPTELIPEDAWEGQVWLSDYVIAYLAERGVEKTVSQLTYGDLTKITEIKIYEAKDPGGDVVYHIPEIIGDFTNLCIIDIKPKIFFPLISRTPESSRYLSNLSWVSIANTYYDEVDTNIIRNNADGIPDVNLYKAIYLSSSYFQDEYFYVNNNFYFDSLCNYGLTDLTGLSKARSEFEILDLSYNSISDISELENISVWSVLDLSCNNLDLEDEETLAVIEKFEQEGCEVITDNQNSSSIDFFEERGYKKYYKLHNPYNFEISLGYGNTEDQLFDVYPSKDALKDYKIFVQDSDIADVYVETAEDGYYKLVCRAKSIGETSVYVMYKENSEILYEIPVTVKDTRFFIEDLEISYYVPEWNPFYAEVDCFNDYDILYYREQGTKDWLSENYGNYIHINKNGLYEFYYVNSYGLKSDVSVFEIEGIKEMLTEEQMPDANLRDSFYETIYVGKEIDYLNDSGMEISDLTGLSLLDFCNCYTLDFSYNKITDITELAKLNLGSSAYIDLRYNNIDFTKPNNEKALRAFLEKGYTVCIDNQFYEHTMLGEEDRIYEYGCEPTDGENHTCEHMIEMLAYNFDPQYLTIARRGDNVATGYRWYVEKGEIHLFVTHINQCGTECFDLYYKGDFTTTIFFTVDEDYHSSNGENIKIWLDSYTKENGFYVRFNNWQESYQYRKQGDEEWTETESSDFFITEEGIYEFRGFAHGEYSDIVTKELKTLEANGITYIKTDGGLMLCEWNRNGIKNFVIPETVEGIPVVDIEMLHSDYNIESITIPKTVKNISRFEDCGNLTSITVDKENPYIYAENNVVISRNYKRMLAYATGLTELVVPEGVRSIQNPAYSYMLEKVSLPKTVATINCFNEIGNLKEVTVAEGNIHFTVINGMLYEKNTGSIIYCPFEKQGEVKIPEGTLFIGEYAFSDCDYIESVIFPKSLIEIKENAFSYCDGIKSITLYANLLRIKWSAFYDNYSLTDLYIIGTPEEWKNVEVHGENYNLLNANWHYLCPCGGYYGEDIIDLPSTCTKKGFMHNVCSKCGNVLYFEIKMKNHIMENGSCTICKSEGVVFESEHNYADNSEEEWCIHIEGAQQIVLNFSEDTFTEEGYDFIYIYQNDQSYIGVYSGYDLASTSISVDGDTVFIRLTSDGSYNGYGFKVTAIGINEKGYDLGDINGDKELDILDFIKLQKIMLDDDESTGASPDIDSNGSINAVDMVILRKYFFGFA